MCPDKLQSRAEALVPQSHGSIDDILPIPTHHYKSVSVQIYKLHTWLSNYTLRFLPQRLREHAGCHYLTRTETIIGIHNHTAVRHKSSSSLIYTLITVIFWLEEKERLVKTSCCFHPKPGTLPPIRAVSDCLGVNLTASQVFHTQREPLSIPYLSLCQCL